MSISSKIRLIKEIVKNMGWRYLTFRSSFELKKKVGILKASFPTNPNLREFISLDQWKKNKPLFLFEDKESINVPINKSDALKEEFNKYQNGKIKYFNASYLNVGLDYDWLTNPDSDFKYDLCHWTEIQDLSEEAGDIKFVWEKSRFSFLYTIVRYDYHFKVDCASIVFKEIESWIDSNPINCGPNYICSQEISLRVVNWTFALYYYADSNQLNETLFQKIMHSIYWQLKHVYANINFSRIAVRNNHAITETMMLFLGGILFPFFPEAKTWKQKGQEWFETEILYQIYEDGTFLQFSHNYHRVLLQLLTFCFYLTEKHNIKLNTEVYSRAKKTLEYLYQCTNEQTGFLPNHGANDGALFFKLNNNLYRDYRAQLNALHYYFYKTVLFDKKEHLEDLSWFNAGVELDIITKNTPALKPINKFDQGGYFTIKEENCLTFIKCGSYKDRPSHADNLHIDIWSDNENILRDAGTYKYNTTPELVKYFNGTKAHNTVTLGDHDQMEKGPRFIWYNWSESVSTLLEEKEDYWEFEGKLRAFKHVGKDIFHIRNVKKIKGEAKWIIEDTLEHKTNLQMNQHWNISNDFQDKYIINSESPDVLQSEEEGFYSGLYGKKENTRVIKFSTKNKFIKTVISKK